MNKLQHLSVLVCIVLVFLTTPLLVAQTHSSATNIQTPAPFWNKLSERPFSISIDGALQSAFSQQSFSAAGEIACHVPLQHFGRLKAFIALGVGSDTIRSDYGKSMIRPSISRGFGVSLRTDTPAFLGIPDSSLGIGICLHQHSAIGQIWEARIPAPTKDYPNATTLQRHEVDISALGAGFYIGYFKRINDVIASVTLDMMYGGRVLTNNIAFSEQAVFRRTVLTKDILAVSGLDFSLTIRLDDISFFYQGIIMSGDIPHLSNGQGIVGIHINGSRIIQGLTNILNKHE